MTSTYYKLWKVKNGWIATADYSKIPDGYDLRADNMECCTVHHSLRAFADYTAERELKYQPALNHAHKRPKTASGAR